MAAKAVQEFAIQNVKNQLIKAEDYIVKQLKDLKADTAIEGKLFENLDVTIAKRTVKLKELAELSQKNNSNWMVLVSDEAWMNQVKKAIKLAFPHLSPSEKDNQTLLIPMPPVTKERKLDVLKDMKTMIEKSRQSVRNIRASARADVKKSNLKGDERFKAEKEIQELVDGCLRKVEKLYSEKQKSFEK